MKTSTWLYSKRFLFLLVFLSGAAGLINQVLWHKYLSILLGAQAKATVIVLSIFLGGISLGYALFGQFSKKFQHRVWFGFSIVELGLGLWALLFPFFFRVAMLLAPRFYHFFGVTSVVPDIFFSMFLLLPPTILMGATLPLLTQAVSDSLSEASQVHARIYGWNTVGAFLGSLLCGYILLPNLDLPSTAWIAGALNIAVAACVYFLYGRKITLAKKPAAKLLPVASHGISLRTFCIFVVGFCSGFYVLGLETVFIRLMGLSSGSSHYNFSLIVSVFVLGLGVGSLVVRKLTHFNESHLLWNQLLVVGTLFLLYLSVDYWPYWVHLVRIVFRDTEPNFYLYQASLGFLFTALLIIPIGFCGFCLPLCFHLLKDKQELLGWRVGQLYGLNTLGCVLGVWGVGFFALQYLNLDQAFKLCIWVAAISCCMALLLLVYKKAKKPTFEITVGCSLLTSVFIALFVTAGFDKKGFIQPFRQQSPLNVSFEGREAFNNYLGKATDYLFYKDGPNSSVAIGRTLVDGYEKSRTIFMNGKSDGNTRGDLLTMGLTGFIPGLLAPKVENTCVIGFGTGITVGSLAKFQENKKVDVVEISETLVANKHFFDDYNGKVSTNPKVVLHSMDAFRFLTGNKAFYDIIVSEPSNPWVAGVENLYTQEFYRLVRTRLSEKGVFAQWVQSYSFNDGLFKLVLNTLHQEFPYVRVFQMLEHDFLLVGTTYPMYVQDAVRAEERWRKNPPVDLALKNMNLSSMPQILAFEVFPPEFVGHLVQLEKDIQTLEKPKLSHGAAKAFFLGNSAKIQDLRRTYKEFYPSVNEMLLSMWMQGKPLGKNLLHEFRTSFCEPQTVARNRTLCTETLVLLKSIDPKGAYDVVYSSYFDSEQARDLASLNPAGGRVGFSRGDLYEVQKGFDFFKKYYSAIAKITHKNLVEKLDKCIRFGGHDQELTGECLLQKAAILEVADPFSTGYLSSVQAFNRWYGKLSDSGSLKERFQKAYEIMVKLESDLNFKK